MASVRALRRLLQLDLHRCAFFFTNLTSLERNKEDDVLGAVVSSSEWSSARRCRCGRQLLLFNFEDKGLRPRSKEVSSGDHFATACRALLVPTCPWMHLASMPCQRLP